MKEKRFYLAQDGTVDRNLFRYDVIREARDRRWTVPMILGEFLRSEAFTKHEMGRFALNTSAAGHLFEGTVNLIHALGITKEEAPTARVLEDYIGAAVTDPMIWSGSWIIDSYMNWPQGTVLPSSWGQLQKV